MNPVALITKKRDGGELTADEIRAFITAFVRGEVPEYQMAAWAMAVYFRGLNSAETAALVEAMLTSGDTLRWPLGTGQYVDKHSTGGVGDKSSLIIAPLLACCGLKVPMLSGRGLGATGGTLDKLEAIPGFRANLSEAEIRTVLDRVGCVITGTTPQIVPADRKLYALRDVTGTVPSIPLICASIMSKKLAEGLNALVLDVKWGSGAFMKRYDDARALAELMVATGEQMGVRTTALLTDMNQPNGRLAGHAVEVAEALDVLRGGGPTDLRQLSLALAAELLVSTGGAKDISAAMQQLEPLLVDGSALDKFEEMIAAQGGDLSIPRPIAPASDVVAAETGFVAEIDAEQLGWALIEMGAGRKKLGDGIDHSAGLEMLVRVGDAVERGQPLVRVFASDEKAEVARRMVAAAIRISPQPVAALPLFRERIAVALSAGVGGLQ